jgi:hypothetical protein
MEAIFYCRDPGFDPTPAPCDTHGGQSGPVTSISASISVSSWRYNSTVAPYSSLAARHTGYVWEPATKRNCFGIPLAVDRQEF